MKSPSRKEYLKERFKEPATCNMWQCCCRSHVAKKVKPRQLFKRDNKVLQKKRYHCIPFNKEWSNYMLQFGLKE